MFHRRRLFYRVARIVAMFFIGLVVALLIALSQVNLETLREDLVHTMRDATGLNVEIDGKISWKFSMRPKVELNQVRIPNEEWAKNKNGFTAEKVDVTLNLISLLRSRPTIQNIKIYDAVVAVEENDADNHSMVRHAPHTEEEPDNNNQRDEYPFHDMDLGSVEVRDLTIYTGNAKYEVTGFQINYRQAKKTREYSGWFKSDSKVFPFILSFLPYNSERKVYPVNVAMSTGGEALIANIALEGTSLMPIDFIVKGHIPDLTPLGKMFDVELPQMPPIKVNLSGGFGHKKLTLRKSLIAFNGTDFDISGSADWGGEVPAITAKIKSKKIDLMEMFPEMYSSPTKKWVRPKRDLNVFKDTPLFGKELLGKNLNLELQVGKLAVYREMVIDDVNIHAKLKDAHLRFAGSAKYAGGELEVATDITADNDGHLSVRAAGVGEQIYVGEILKSLRENDFISELPMNFEFYLQGAGSDLSELVSNTTGPIRVYSTARGYAHSDLVAFVYGTDFLTDLRHQLQDMFRSEKKYNQITIDCASLNLKLRNGVVETTTGVAIETNAINVRLVGMVDFGREKMKASLVTVPSRGLKISITGSLTNSMTFTGVLAEPDVKISGAAVAGKVATGTGIGLLLAPLTGGLSVVAGAGIGLVAGDFLENWLSDPHPCKTARESGAPAEKGDPEWLNQPMPSLVGDLVE